jgi:hypothetical protein
VKPTAELLVIDSVGQPVGGCAGQRGDQRLPERPPHRLDLPDIAVEVNAAIAGQVGGSKFATAVLARLDLDAGPAAVDQRRPPRAADPARIVAGTAASLPDGPAARPAGGQAGLLRDPAGARRSAAAVHRRHHRGSRSGREFFGKQRLADFVSATVAAGRPALETVRRLMRPVLSHPAEQPQGDNRAQMARNDPYLAAPVALTGATWGLTSGCRLRAASGIAYGG